MAAKMSFESSVREDGVLVLANRCGSEHNIELWVRVGYKKSDDGKQPGVFCTKAHDKTPMTFAQIMEYVEIDFIMMFQDILESDVEKTSDFKKCIYKNGLGLMNRLYHMACEHNPAHASMKLFR